jgi:AFG3 family protein
MNTPETSETNTTTPPIVTPETNIPETPPIEETPEQKAAREKTEKELAARKKRSEHNPNDPKPNYYWLIGLLAFLIGFTFLFPNWDVSSTTLSIDQSMFESIYTRGDVKDVKVVNRYVKVFLKADSLKKACYIKDKKPLFAKKDSLVPNYSFTIASPELFKKNMDDLQLRNPTLEHIPITFPDERNMWEMIFGLLPYLFIIAVWIIIMKRMGGGFGGGQMFSIGKSKAKLFENGSLTDITFADVAGLDEEKQEVMEIVSFLKEPEKYTNLGGKIPKGALLIGPPGTGKTLLAKAMAGEAQVPFFSLSGSDFVEMFVGVGASRVRDLFNQAREKAPCIVFIDEIDAIGRSRGKNTFNTNDERENTLNQLLVEMDGFVADKGVIMLAATNRPDVLDEALLRPGRFDRQITVDRPDIKGREAIFLVHLKPIKIKEENVDAKKLASQTPGFVGADIANVCNEAALIAARNNKEAVDMDDFQAAIDRVIGGLEKKNTIIQPHEKVTVAYHEAGHAICGWFLEHCDPLVKVTIVPRGSAGGYAQYLPKEKFLTIKEELFEKMVMSLGGRAAEQITFGKISTGALSDLDYVTKIAYSMVTVYGMSEKVGNVSYYKMAENSFDKPYSQKTAELIDEEVRAFVSEAYKKALELLTERKPEMELLAQHLIEKEVLFKDDVTALIGRRPFEKDEPIEEVVHVVNEKKSEPKPEEKAEEKIVTPEVKPVN